LSRQSAQHGGCVGVWRYGRFRRHAPILRCREPCGNAKFSPPQAA
jgi:hypothetical protein